MEIIKQNYNNISFTAKPIPQKVIRNTKKQLLNKDVRKIDIFCHSSADEDTINSAKVFSNWLTSHGKKVNICVPLSEIKELYINPAEYNIKSDFKTADRIVCLDFNAKERLNNTFKELFFRTSSESIIGYDHHTESNTTLNKNIYIDDTAKSCCSILTRFFESLGEKINKKDRMSLYCGMISDYKKSSMIEIENNNGIYRLQKTNKLLNDKNSLEIFNKLDKSLNQKVKQAIYKHLDPLSRLSEDEKKLQRQIYKAIKISGDGEIAYVTIPPNDKLWAKVGMDTVKTSEILKDLRVRIIKKNFDNNLFTEDQKEKLKNVKTAIAFYRKSNSKQDEYRISIHSSNNSAIALLEQAKLKNPNIIAGGHKDRAGGKIDSIAPENVHDFVTAFINK